MGHIEYWVAAKSGNFTRQSPNKLSNPTEPHKQ